MLLFGILMALLVAAAGLLYWRRLERLRPEDTRLTDDLIRRIEREGRIELDEPLDWEEIRAEEEEFWRETWDEPEEL
jgi:hypothetical protein